MSVQVRDRERLIPTREKPVVVCGAETATRVTCEGPDRSLSVAGGWPRTFDVSKNH